VSACTRLEDCIPTMSTKPKPVKRTASQSLLTCSSDGVPSSPDIDYFELQLRPESLRLISQFFITANQFNRLKLQGSYGNDLALVCSSPVCVYGRFSESDKQMFCSAMHAKGSTFRPSLNANRVVSSSKTIYAEDLIESLQCVGLTSVIVAAAGTKCHHSSLRDFTLDSNAKDSLGNGFIDLATNLELNNMNMMPALSASPGVHKGTTKVFPMFSYIGKRHGSVLWTGSVKSGIVKIKVYPAILHQLKLAISGRADLQYPSSSISCLKRRAANLQRCIHVLSAQQQVKQRVRVEARVCISELGRVMSSFETPEKVVQLLQRYANVRVLLLKLDDVIEQATYQHATLTRRLVAANSKRATKQQIQLYCDCVSSIGFSYPALIKHSFKNPLRKKFSDATSDRTQYRARTLLKRAAITSKNKRTKKSKQPKVAPSPTESVSQVSLLQRKYREEVNRREPMSQPQPQLLPTLQAQPDSQPLTGDMPEQCTSTEQQTHATGFTDSLNDNSHLIEEILRNVPMAKNIRWPKKLMCHMKDGRIGGCASDKYELAEYILATYGVDYKEYLKCL
jgi:hypothetical protein